MMAGKYQQDYLDEANDELCAPVVAVKGGLAVSELLRSYQTEFEVRPNEDDEDEDNQTNNSAEAQFNFDDLQNYVNLNAIDLDDEDNEEDSAPFDKYRRKMQDVRDDGKIKKWTLKEGSGPLVPEGCRVYIRYIGYFEYQEVPFDSTVLHCNGEGDFPIPINLGKGELILGLHEAVLTMRRGERAEFLIHYDLAYGKFGCPPRIPPESTVLFIVEIDRFVDCGDLVVNNDELSQHERNQYCNVNKIARAHHNLAKDFFAKGNYHAAANKYRQVINMMHNARLANEEEEIERNRFLLKNYTNTCICYKKLKQYKRICIMAADAMQVDEKEALQNYKLLYFWGYAKMILNDFKGAKQHLLAANKLKPEEKEIAETLIMLEKRKNSAAETERIMMRRAFGLQPNQTTVTEIDESDEHFRRSMLEQLEEFKRSPNKELTLTDNFTGAEEITCVELARELGVYARVVDGNRRIIHITKPEADI